MALHPTNKPVLVYTWTNCQTHRRTLTNMDWRNNHPTETARISSQQRQRWSCCSMVIIKRKCSVAGNCLLTDIIWVGQRANRFLCRRSDVECLMWSSPQSEGKCNSRFMSFLICSCLAPWRPLLQHAAQDSHKFNGLGNTDRPTNTWLVSRPMSVDWWLSW